MTAAAANRDAGKIDGDLCEGGVAASATIYKNTMLMWNATGYLTPMTDASGNVFAGVSDGDAVGGDASGNVRIKYWRKGAFEFVNASAAITLNGDLMYPADDPTVTGTAGTKTCVGRAVKYLNSGKQYVDIGGYC